MKPLRALIGLLAAVLFGGYAFAHEPDPTPRTVIMTAYGPEWTALKAQMTEVHTDTYADVTYLVGKLRGKEVVLFRSGVSLVNAAMTAQAAIDHYTVKRILFSGIAGGINPDLSVGDVVVAEHWSQYLESVFARKTETGYFVPQWLGKTLPNYGMIYPYEVGIAHPGQDRPEHRFWFDADPDLIKVARSVASKATLKSCLKPGQCLTHKPRVVVGGNGVSGSAFVDNAEFRKWVFDTFKASVVDNESAAVAHVAYANHLPYIAFRSLSDLAGGGEGENTMDTFEGLASDNSAAVVMAFLDALPD
jgi:adenosylhomocysteine nucleosidase